MILFYEPVAPFKLIKEEGCDEGLTHVELLVAYNYYNEKHIMKEKKHNEL